jgi:hypothetical protein
MGRTPAAAAAIEKTSFEVFSPCGFVASGGGFKR